MTRYTITGGLIAYALFGALESARAGDVPIANPPGPKAEILVGALDKPGLYIIRAHVPADGLMKPHQHTDTRYISVVSGVIYVCTTGTVSAATTVAHKAGEFFVMPANTTHCAWGKDGPAEYLEIGVGPTGTKFVEK